MVVEPIATDPLVLVRHWGLQQPLGKERVSLARIDVDHRVGGTASLDLGPTTIDLKQLRSGSVCLLHRDNRTRLIFPSSVERMTRLFIGYTHSGGISEIEDRDVETLPLWPKDDFAGAKLLPVVPPTELKYCESSQCDFRALKVIESTGG